MFKLGGDTIDAQGSGITSGLDTPRNNYVEGGTIGGGAFTGTPMGNRTGFQNIYPKPKPKVPFDARIRTAMNKLKVDPQDYRQATWEGVAGGFGDPSTKTLSEAVWKANMMRKEGIKPLEASVAKQKFELSKLPFERTIGIDVAEASKRELEIRVEKEYLDKATALQRKANTDYPKGDIPQDVRDQIESLNILALGSKYLTVAEAWLEAEAMYSKEIYTNSWSYRQIQDAKANLVKQLTGDRFPAKIEKEEIVVEENATGGRVGYQDGLGPNIMQTSLQENIQTPGGDVAVSEQIDEANVPVTQPQGSGLGENSQAYALLRARLPQEITDDVVRLIAYNPQAFEDFAAIQTQSDVMAFNMKYGVELVIPAQEV